MKSVNKVILLGNLTRDPELKQSADKKPVCVFGLARALLARKNVMV
jgi:single-stranded DNA-binding protein